MAVRLQLLLGGRLATAAAAAIRGAESSASSSRCNLWIRSSSSSHWSTPTISSRRSLSSVPTLVRSPPPFIIMSTLPLPSSSTTTFLRDQPDDHDDHVLDIEDLLHQAALNEGKTTYQDPSTGFTVFTELSHLKRGVCCGNLCRHCPYGYVNVPVRKLPNPDMDRNKNKVAKVQSGDTEATQRLVQQILENAANTRASGGTTTPTTGSTTATTSKNVPYTRRGDGGTSQLGTGERRSKDDCNFEALGTVDELCSVVGVVHATLAATLSNNHDTNDQLELLSTRLLDIMSRLFDIGSHVAKPRDPGTAIDFTPNGIGDGFDTQHIDDLEGWINEMTEILPELTSFILPTGAPPAAHLHVARTVCRRAERRMVPLVTMDRTCDPNAMKYLNRLSDFFFVAARMVNYCEGMEEIQYQRETPQTTQRQRVSRSLQHQDE